ncbi:50S ribosomal protein L3 [Longirhabdus pacifica]|uniref:50S ribosomal protein L3 n=1 Tax=Longirhabdus pacifica TaxID=2305227 RepID=UPI001008F79C|nr:50S ribosomal protein L3 [Longirhabdus pacifica]
MTKGILGRKLGMTQVFTPEGVVIPVTVIEAGPCVVLQKKEKEIDGYDAVQLGYSDKKEIRSIKAEIGHAKKAESTPKRYIKEFRDAEGLELGQEVKADIFAPGDFVDVSGTSKGKGFQGSIKRHNQSRGPMTHGSHYHRGPGSMGSIAANRVFKGKKLPGHMGSQTKTIQNLEIIKVDAERNLLLVKGSIPGPKKSYVSVQSSVKK